MVCCFLLDLGFVFHDMLTICSGFISNRPRFDPNASTSTLKQGDFFRLKSGEAAPSDNVRESGSSMSHHSFNGLLV